MCVQPDARRIRGSSPHVLVARTDKIFLTFAHHCKALRLHSVVKLGSSQQQKKMYSSYRSRVEEELTAAQGRGAAKYGHGGEGNEQRRFCAFPAQCLDGDCCMEGCGACAMLRNNMPFVFQDREARLFSAAQPAVDEVASPIVAMVVCRAVVGQPSFTRSIAAGSHSFVEPRETYDVVTVFEPAAVDLLFLVVGTKLV